MSRREREQAHRQAVEENKARIRGLMREGEHIYGEETRRAATFERDYAEADALEELMPEIREHNARVGGGTKARVQEIQEQERRRDYERRQKLDGQRARQQVEDYARNRPGPNLDAARNQPHGSALESPSGTVDSEQERYRRELAAFEEKARQARKEGYAHSLVPPTPPKKKQATLLPY